MRSAVHWYRWRVAIEAEHIPITLAELHETLILIAVGCQTTPSSISRQLMIPLERCRQILKVGTELSLVRPGHRLEDHESFTLTTQGSRDLSKHLQAARVSLVPAPGQVLSKFNPLDKQFKDIALQMLNEGIDGQSTARIDGLLTKAILVLDELSGWGLRFGGYRSRLEHASLKLLEGRHQYLVDPHVDSAHAIWWEWHADLKIVVGVDDSQ